MAFEAFLAIIGDSIGASSPIRVLGETTDAKHPNTILVSSFEFGVENKTTVGTATGGAGAGKATLQTLKITKPVDSASPGLFAVSAAGAHFNEARLFIRRVGSNVGDHLVYRFKLVYVNAVDWSGSSGDEQPQETVSFSYGALTIAYSQQNPTGQLAQPKLGTWNAVTNTSDFTVPGVPDAP